MSFDLENTKDSKRKYWVSLEQLQNDPEFIANSKKEFVSSPIIDDSKLSPGKNSESPMAEGASKVGATGIFDRRDFMKLMAASTAMASAACYQKPMHKILPYVNQPPEVTFGIANYYASVCGECGAGCGTLVKTREGRPIKLEGNPDHPMNKGGLCARGQSSLLNLYDPDRLRRPMIGATGTTWEIVDKEVSEKLKATKHIRLLTETIHSPSTLKLAKQFLTSFANSGHVVYEPISSEAIIEGQNLSYGEKILPRFRFDKADVIVSFDADFLGTWISPVEFTKQFSAKRKLSKAKKSLSKLYAFESMMTLTGTNADVREAIAPSEALTMVLSLASELHSRGLAVDAANSDILSHYKATPSIKTAAADLMKAQGRSLVVAGSPHGQTENALAIQVAVNMINSMLKNDGETVDHNVSPSNQMQGSYKELSGLIKEMNDGKVDTLIIYKANPVYTLPLEAGFTEALKKVKTILYIGNELNETALLSNYVLPDHHSLEAWNDSEPQKNLFSIQQPTIRALYDTRQFQDSLLVWGKAVSPAKFKSGGAAGDLTDWHSYLQHNWETSIFKSPNNKISPQVSFINFWESALRDGISLTAAVGRDKSGSARSFHGSLKNVMMANKTNSGKSSSTLEAVLYAQIATYDGSSANNPWLQELPDPITRVCWDNYASVAPATAKKLGLMDGDIVKFKVGAHEIEIPAHVQAGLSEKVVAVALGYGREATGSIGNGIGKNFFRFAKMTANGGMQYAGMQTELTKTGEKYVLANPQQNQSMEGRDIIKEASYKDWLENPSAGNETEKDKLTTLWTPHKYEGYRWGMAIDMNSCTGCNACVVSCQSENNIPVVGKDGVNRGRIMHWIRIDRYYTGTVDAPQVAFQPMLCQHCENAPCETVCPVLATVHDSEGLNSQIYNRCVGTRYCANNCPYKVRRFNWFEYNYGGQTKYPSGLAQNPEVTVRSRGVMEKCSFCIQRIHDSRNVAKNLGRPIKDGEVKTACQQSCPADAITFGNINDPESEISRISKDPRGYHVLEELNVRPSITYLTKIRNTETV